MIWLSIDFDYFIREEEAWDWSHGEALLYAGTTMWAIREAQALVANQDLRAATDPNKFAKPKPLEFFGTLADLGYDFSSTPVFVADSHALGYPTFCNMPQKGEHFLLNFDAHHDMGYDVPLIKEHLRAREADCGDWLLMTMMHCKRTHGYIVYPPWKGMSEWTHTFGRISKEASAKYEKVIRTMVTPFVWAPNVVKTFAKKVDCIFICRSGSWVPPWHDKLFVRFVESATNLTGGTPLNVYTSTENIDPLVPRDYSFKEIKKLAKQFKTQMGKLDGKSKVAS